MMRAPASLRCRAARRASPSPASRSTRPATNSPGIFAYSEAGNVGVTSDAVVTHGDYAGGIIALSDIYGGAATTLTVQSGFVATVGDHSGGIYALGSTSVAITSDTVNTYGDNSLGITGIQTTFAPQSCSQLRRARAARGARPGGAADRRHHLQRRRHHARRQ